jgi:adenylyltransferase/sulfurtransferase
VDFTDEQVLRYSRHIILPEVGGKGQAKIANAKVFIVGAGGLGCPVGYYLTAAGVGTIGIIDNDTVELSNLQRQIAHSVDTLGMPKVESAKKTFETLNPDVNIIAFHKRISKDDIIDLIKDYDIVVDGSDNFPTRYLVNDACVMAGKPLVSGAILRFEGQVITTIPGEVLKLILGKGDLLKGELLIYNALQATFRKVKVPKNPLCPVCGENPTITELIDYSDEYCTMQ